jgi:hypothetical protein
MAHCLENKTITAIEIASDRKAMRFLIDGGEPIVAKADGDCCSSSWIEHIEIAARGFPATVVKVEDLDLPGSTDNDREHECLQVYGLEITTDKGEIVIDFRNSSNGYYGGNLSWPDDYFYGGVSGQNVSTEEWQAVSE